MNCKLLAAILLLLIQTVNAQDSAKAPAGMSAHAIGATLGINQLKEENLLPRVHSGFITMLSYDYLGLHETLHHLHVGLGFSRVITQPEDLTKSVNGRVVLSYSYAFKTAEAQRFTYYLGPQASAAYSVSFYPNWDDSHLYWANLFSLGIVNAACYTFEDNTKLVSTLSLPLLSLYSRPDALRLYKIDEVSFGGIAKNLHSNIHPAFLNKAFALHFDIEYQFPVFRSKTEAFRYSLDYMRIGSNSALAVTQIVHQLGLRILL